MVKSENFTRWDSAFLSSINKHFETLEEDISLEEYLDDECGFIQFLKEDKFEYEFGRMSKWYKNASKQSLKELDFVTSLAFLIMSHFIKRVYE